MSTAYWVPVHPGNEPGTNLFARALSRAQRLSAALPLCRDDLSTQKGQTASLSVSLRLVPVSNVSAQDAHQYFSLFFSNVSGRKLCIFLTEPEIEYGSA